DAPDYENLGPEDSLKPKRQARGPKRDFDKPKGHKRRRGDDEAPPHHPAYEPLDMKALAGNSDDEPGTKRRPAKQGDDRRKPKARAASKETGAKKKSAKKNKPSRAARKAAKAKKP
ncbi:MAG: ATP-dependent RNA helicase, partial [Pseudomonadota bacterium]